MARADSAIPASAVAEIQGLYGAFTFPEKLLQKIWLRGDFDRTGAVTADGRGVRIVHPGKWNLLGGPDFRGARLRFGDGPELTGDIEVHLRVGDWDAHGHVRDAAYDRVVLHVVLFPPGPGTATSGAGGREIPVLALLPLLHHDLEAFAAEEAVEQLADRAGARIPDELGQLAPGEAEARLRAHADARWRQKTHFARLRVHRLGWAAACHHTALEILGYRFNRAPMLRIAGARPLAAWAGGGADPDAAYAEEHYGWSLQGVRPANRPLVRLRQYAAWVRAVPAWPDRLAALGAELPDAAADAPTRAVRRTAALPAWRERLAAEICGGAIGGPRLDTTVCDGFLPLLAAAGAARPGLWHHWPPGDVPPQVRGGLRHLGLADGRTRPACHGLAQGLLGWLIDRDAKA